MFVMNDMLKSSTNVESLPSFYGDPFDFLFGDDEEDTVEKKPPSIEAASTTVTRLLGLCRPTDRIIWQALAEGASQAQIASALHIRQPAVSVRMRILLQWMHTVIPVHEYLGNEKPVNLTDQQMHWWDLVIEEHRHWYHAAKEVKTTYRDTLRWVKNIVEDNNQPKEVRTVLYTARTMRGPSWPRKGIGE